MLPSVTNLKSNRRGAASIALLAALLALVGGTQALAPAPAAAMIDLSEECGGPVVVDPSFCDENGGGAGQAGTGGNSTGADTDNWQKPEVINVGGQLGPCLRSPASCLPKETGGGRQARADGPRIPLRSRHGAKPARVAEIQLTRDECAKLIRGLPVLGSDLVAEGAHEEYVHIKTKISLINQILERLEKRSEGLKTRAKYLRSISHPSMHDQGEILELEEKLETTQRDQIEPLKQKLDSLERWRRAKDESLNHLAGANEIAHKTLRGECERKYPRLYGK